MTYSGSPVSHRRHGPLRADADDNAVRFHQILDGKTFAEKFRITDHVEFDARLAVALDRFGHLFTRPHGHGAFVHNDPIGRHGAGDFAGDLFDETQVDGPVRQRRGGHGDENDVGLFHALGGAGREVEPAGRHVPLHQIL